LNIDNKISPLPTLVQWQDL